MTLKKRLCCHDIVKLVHEAGDEVLDSMDCCPFCGEYIEEGNSSIELMLKYYEPSFMEKAKSDPDVPEVDLFGALLSNSMEVNMAHRKGQPICLVDDLSQEIIANDTVYPFPLSHHGRIEIDY